MRSSFHELFRMAVVVGAAALTSLSGCAPEIPDLIDRSADVSEAETDPRSLDQGSLTIMTWNVKGSAFRTDPDHLKKIADVIEELSPDVVMLQEIHRNTGASGGLDQFEVLTKALGMSGCFGESLEIKKDGSYGNAILTNGRITDSRISVLPGRGEPRTVLECESEWDGLDIPLLTTHLTAWDRANRRTRALQTAAIATLLESNGSPLLVLGGDFNAALTSPEMAALVETSFVRSVITDYVVTHPGTGRSYDHLLAGDGWTIEDGRVIRQGPSDHWPVLARLSLNEDRDDNE